MFLRKKVLAISSIEAFLQKTSGSLHTHPHRAKAGWIHLNFSTSSRANWWGGRGARNWEWKCETREKQAGGFLSKSNHSQGGFLSKNKSSQVDFFPKLNISRCISFKIKSFKVGVFFKIRWISFQDQIFYGGLLSKLKYFKVDFFSWLGGFLPRWIFQLESFKMDFFLRSDGFSFQIHIVNFTSFKVERWIHFWRELYR